MSTNQILVTAATGNVGAPLVQALQRKDMPFEAATRDAEQARGKLGDSVSTVYLDYEEPSSFSDAVQGNDLLFFCGPSATPNAAELMKPMVEEAAKHDIKHIVFIASYPDVGDTIKQSGIDYTFINANFFMQNFELYQIEDIRDKKQIFLPCGEGKAAFIHAKDIGEVAAEILAEPEKYQQESVDITGPESIDLFEAAAAFSEVLGTEIEYKNPDADTYRTEMEDRGYSDEYIEAMISVFGKIKGDYATETSPAVEQILDRKPLTLTQYAVEEKDLFQ